MARDRVDRVVGVVASCLIVIACGRPSTQPTTVQEYAPPAMTLVADAAAYWEDVIGLPIHVLDEPRSRRILIRTGTDLGGMAGRGLVDGVDARNAAVSGLIVLQPIYAGCEVNTTFCRRLYRHELGHALGFFGHSDEGLMAPSGSGAELSDRDRRMMSALYAIPAGAFVDDDGTWWTEIGERGAVDASVAADILTWNVKAAGGGSYRLDDRVCRWVDSVPLYVPATGSASD